MCFYDQHRFSCGDRKWGHFRQHCSKDLVVGETCGTKLIMQTIPTGTKCKLCEKIDTKMRRRAAEVERVSRWRKDESKFRASIDKSIEMVRGLDHEIYELGCERSRRLLQDTGGTTSSSSSSGSNPKYRTISNAQNALATASSKELVDPNILQEVDPDPMNNPGAISTPSIASGSVIPLRAEQNSSQDSVQDDSSDESDDWDLYEDEMYVNDGSVDNSNPDEDKPGSGDNLLFPPLSPETSAPVLRSQESRYKLVKKTNLMYGLPMTFEGDSGPATIMAVPDSGSSHNVMSRKLALHLGLRVEWEESEKMELKLLDGSAAVCTTIVQASCRFARTFAFDWKMRCTFLVLPSLVEDLIMSASFLEKTATFTMFHNRLVQMSLRRPEPPRVCALGAIRQRLTCCIDGEAVAALPDSGSDVDVVSLAYATKRRFKWQDTCEQVVFADGRTKTACGKFVAQLSLGSFAQLINVNEDDDPGDDFNESVNTQRETKELTDGKAVVQSPKVPKFELEDAPVQHVIRTTFYILDEITVNALIGAKSIESLQVYTCHTQYLNSQAERDFADSNLYRITLANEIRSCVKNVLPSSKQRRSERLSPSLEEQLNEVDQQENARREEASSKASQLIGEARVIFDREEDSKRRAYEEYRAHLLRAWTP